ncbi:hypothetical protein ACH33_13725 [Aneurinibacillus sp. XH2]|nr:hypothetical protein ACH33_13725 [Aneurinibacillus sp. XH2]
MYLQHLFLNPFTIIILFAVHTRIPANIFVKNYTFFYILEHLTLQYIKAMGFPARKICNLGRRRKRLISASD